MPLSDLDALKQKLNSEICSAQHIASTIKKGKQTLFNAFDEGISVTHLIKQYAFYIDTVLEYCFKFHLSPQQQKLCSLVAVGGYGRKELLPASDVDLLLLLDGEPDQEFETSLSTFLTVLWDFGLEIGHSVRTISDCIEQGQDDITVITNMIESRYISGSMPLYNNFQQAISVKNLWPARAFFEAKLQELDTRHAKFGNTAYNLEPDIKEGPGGLRDIQIIGWVAKRQFQCEKLEDLVAHKFLSEEEFKTLFTGQELLWKIRFALHRLCKRREDRLLFEHQSTLAEQFGYKTGPNNLSIEQFMQSYYRTIKELERISEMLLQLFKEEILFAEAHDPGSKINDDFIIRNGFIEVAHADVFMQNPSALIRIFIHLQSNDDCKGVHASTIRLIRDNLYLIDDNFRNDNKINALFLRFMRQQKGITHQLRRMNTYGVLAAYIPAFEQIVGRMQYDLYHAYTVDTHTLFVIRNLRRFAVAKHYDEFPLCSEIHGKIKKPELLYLAGLFHDIAKGRGGDHAELGARDALQFCFAHSMTPADAKIVSNLVKLHLIMSMTAQKQDTSDPVVIFEFSEQVGSSELLDYLYLLTVADIRATNPKQWNNWKDALLKELYYQTKRVLDNPDQIIKSSAKLALENKQRACNFLSHQDIDPNDLKSFCDTLPDEYFIQHSSDEISWQVQGILNNKNKTTVLIQTSERYKTTEICVYTRDNKHIIYRVATALHNLNMSVLGARTMPTDDEHLIDTFMVQEQNGSHKISNARQQEIEKALYIALDKKNTVSRQMHKRISRQLKVFELETELVFTQDYPNHKTILEITANDRPGLLSAVAQVLEQRDVNICHAIITTLGEKANDIFAITSQNGKAITDEATLNELHDKLIESIAEIY